MKYVLIVLIFAATLGGCAIIVPAGYGDNRAGYYGDQGYNRGDGSYRTRDYAHGDGSYRDYSYRDEPSTRANPYREHGG